MGVVLADPFAGGQGFGRRGLHLGLAFLVGHGRPMAIHQRGAGRPRGRGPGTWASASSTMAGAGSV